MVNSDIENKQTAYAHTWNVWGITSVHCGLYTVPYHITVIDGAIGTAFWDARACSLGDSPGEASWEKPKQDPWDAYIFFDLICSLLGLP